MTRTAIMLPEKLKNQAEIYARKANISLAEVIRESLEEKLGREDADPFFSDTSFYDGKTPGDLSLNHDKYLYD